MWTIKRMMHVMSPEKHTHHLGGESAVIRAWEAELSPIVFWAIHHIISGERKPLRHLTRNGPSAVMSALPYTPHDEEHDCLPACAGFGSLTWFSAAQSADALPGADAGTSPCAWLPHSGEDSIFNMILRVVWHVPRW